MTQFLISHSFGSLCVTFENPSVPLLNQHIYKSLGITVDEQRLTCNGRELCDESQLQGDLVLINLNLRLVGGKGGFGSLLRSQKSTKKTTNFGACRTVDGQRLRDVQQQQRVAEAQQNQEAYERNKLNEKRQKQQVTREEEQAAKLIAQEQKLRKEEQTHKEIVSDLKDSVREGILLAQQQKQTQKKQTKVEKALPDDLWGDLLDEEEEENSENDEQEEEPEKDSKKRKHEESGSFDSNQRAGEENETEPKTKKHKPEIEKTVEISIETN